MVDPVPEQGRQIFPAPACEQVAICREWCVQVIAPGSFHIIANGLGACHFSIVQGSRADQGLATPPDGKDVFALIQKGSGQVQGFLA